MITLKANEKSISVKLQALSDAAKEAALGMVLDVAEDAAQASPVDTGAFVESWSLLPKGSGGGRSKSSKTPQRRAVSGKLSAGQKQALREKSKRQLRQDLASKKEAIVSVGGAVIRNRAPHQPYVEARRQIIPYVVDRNS